MQFTTRECAINKVKYMQHKSRTARRKKIILERDNVPCSSLILLVTKLQRLLKCGLTLPAFTQANNFSSKSQVNLS